VEEMFTLVTYTASDIKLCYLTCHQHKYHVSYSDEGHCSQGKRPSEQYIVCKPSHYLDSVKSILSITLSLTFDGMSVD
jgi:hypothetical protein